jgi:hypothetical protein
MALVVAGSCAPRTKMLNSWTEPSFQHGTVKKVLVLGIAQNPSVRRQFEDDFVTSLKSLGYEAVASYFWLPEVSKDLDRDLLAAKVRENSVTHVIVTRLVDQKTVTSYTPPSYASVGVSPYYPGYYGSYYSYWSVGYTTMVSPGYVTEELVVSLETNLYEAATEKLIWTGLTETWISGSPSANVEAVIKKVVYELRSK